MPLSPCILEIQPKNSSLEGHKHLEESNYLKHLKRMQVFLCWIFMINTFTFKLLVLLYFQMSFMASLFKIKGHCHFLKAWLNYHQSSLENLLF